jgi:hypothetical protein
MALGPGFFGTFKPRPERDTVSLMGEGTGEGEGEGKSFRGAL